MHGTTTDRRAAQGVAVNETVERRLKALADFMVEMGKSKATAKSYAKAVRRVAGAMGGKDPVEWDDADLAALVKTENWRGWSGSTRNIARHALKAYWEHTGTTAPDCLEFEKAGAKAYGHNRAARMDELRAQAPSPDDVARVLAYCRDVVLHSRDNDLVVSAMSTFMVAAYGLRCVDLASVRVGDVDLAKGVLHVPKGKGGKARDVFMDVDLSALWKPFMSARVSLLAARKGPCRGSVATNDDFSGARADTLFFTRGPRAPADGGDGDVAKALASSIPRLVGKALGRHVNAHAFRHAKVFELLGRGLPIETVAQYMGHSSVDITMSYRWREAEAQRAAFEKAGNGAAPAPAAAPPAPPAAAPATDKAAVVAGLLAAVKSGALSDASFLAAVQAIGS